MNLGFYYHIPIRRTEEGLLLPGYLAVFVDALAKEVSQLTLFLHEEKPGEMNPADTVLKENNISWVNLGPKTPAWHRSLLYTVILKQHVNEFKRLDLLLVRSPSPLAPYFERIIPKSKIGYFVVGDYEEGAKGMKINTVRDWLIKIYTLWNHKQFMRALKNSFVIVNSRLLYKKLSKITTTIYEVKTTTLSLNDFYCPAGAGLESGKGDINILFTGRIVPDKGLDFVVEACKQLINEGLKIKFHVAGMLVQGKEEYIDNLKDLCQLDDRSNFLVYHGYKKVGEELNKLYRSAHIYIIASLNSFEGFPRTIWEALANSCPVIATKVGSIPYFLEHEKHALLIEPKDTDAIKDAILRLATDENLRRSLILNGYKLATENTLEIQTKKLAELLRSQQEEV